MDVISGRRSAGPRWPFIAAANSSVSPLVHHLETGVDAPATTRTVTLCSVLKTFSVLADMVAR
ncbi:hypothetical protein [Nonomuraea bangladeshensis]|uniref:hypothetical protein n=1 Tax=Nonomuraea bangladeshensis TaxID=404385 RepID=UPI003C2F3C0B